MAHSSKLPQASQGVVLIEVIGEDTTSLKLTNENHGKILRGKVISVGEEGFSDFGAKIKVPCKKNDLVWFLTYEGGYDTAVIDGKVYTFALFKDIRGIEK